MENLTMDTNMLMMIGGGVILLLIVVYLIIRKKRKGSQKDKPVSSNKNSEKLAGKKYQSNEPSEEELENAPKLVLEKFDDGQKSLSFRFKIQGGKIKLDEIDPYDNPWIKVLNYNELVGQTRSHGQILHVYFDRKERKRPSKIEKSVINIVYRELNGKQWIQQYMYSSDSGVKASDLRTLS
jgi:hypothetical protein